MLLPFDEVFYVDNFNDGITPSYLLPKFRDVGTPRFFVKTLEDYSS